MRVKIINIFYLLIFGCGMGWTVQVGSQEMNMSIVKSQGPRRKRRATSEPIIRIYAVLGSAMLLAGFGRVVVDMWQPDYSLLRRVLDTTWF